MWNHDRTRTIVETLANDGETRNVSCDSARDGSLIIRETSTGPLTTAIFGTSSRSHQIYVSTDSLAGLGWALGALVACTTAEDVIPYVQLFMKGEQLFLSDLMDLMDGQNLPYVYASYTSYGDFYFRPPQTVEATCAQ